MQDIISIYVQPGERGFHAGVRGHSRVWSSHQTDPITAAWRAALRRWFPKRPNDLITYQEAHAITVRDCGDGSFEATLNLADELARTQEWARDFTPQIPALRSARRRTKSRRKK